MISNVLFDEMRRIEQKPEGNFALDQRNLPTTELAEQSSLTHCLPPIGFERSFYLNL